MRLMEKTVRKRILAPALLAVLLAVTAMMGVQGASAETPLVTDAFDTVGYTASYGQTPAGGKEAGLRLAGSAPASVALRQPIAGDFSLRFYYAGSSARLTLEDGSDNISAELSFAAGTLTAACGGESRSVPYSAPEAVTVQTDAEKGTLSVTAGGTTVSFAAGLDFSGYTVTFTATENRDGAADMYLYTLCGYSLSLPVFTGLAATLYAPTVSGGIVGKSYELPPVYASDPVNGAVPGGRVSVLYGETVVLPETEWTEGLAFTPSASGRYTLRYAAGGQTADYIIDVEETARPSTVRETDAFAFSTVGVGSQLVLPYVTFANDLYYREIPAVYTVSIDGGSASEPAPSAEGRDFVFGQAGTYDFVFRPDSALLDDTYTVRIAVRPDMAALSAGFPDETLYKGDTFTPPAATLTYNGESVAADTVVHFPSGRALCVKQLTLEEAGIYTIEYRAVMENRLHSYRYDIRVDERLHAGGSTVTYGPMTEYFSQSQTGLTVELTANSTYEFRDIIDLSDNTTADSSVIDFYILPYAKGTPDFTMLDITLTDAYDPSISVTVNFIHNTADYGMTYVRAQASNQSDRVGIQWRGYDAAAGTPITSVHKNNPYGFMGKLAFAGDQNLSYPGNYERMDFNLCYNITTETLYGDHAWYSYGDRDSRVITRLNDSSLYRESFPGFTTGEVRLSIRASNFSSSRGRIFIKSIDGADLSGETVTDTDPPRISVDTLGYGTLPDAVVGRPYPLFSASATDAQSGAVQVDTQVWFVDRGRQAQVSVEDGTFTPFKTGDYTIRYTASDYYGNTAVTELTVHAADSWNPIEVPPLTDEDGVTGTVITLLSPVPAGGHGKVTLTSLSVRDEAGNAIPVTDNTFLPEHEGLYTATYVFTDYLGESVTASYTIDVTTDAAPILSETPVLPKAFIDGASYALPELTAYDYNTGAAVPVAGKIYVEDGAGRRPADGVYTVSGGTEAVVSYVFETAYGSHTETYTVPVRNLYPDGTLDITQFIVADDGCTVQSGDSYTTVTTPEDTTFFFANPILADGFDVQLRVDADKNDLSAVSITLRDYDDRSVALTVTWLPDSDDRSASWFVVGDTRMLVNGSFYGDTAFTFRVNYDGELMCISDMADIAIYPSVDDNGRVFAGFPSGRVYCEVSMTGVGDAAALRLTSVGGQPLLNLPVDMRAPNIAFEGTMKVTYEIGDTVQIPAAIAGDVLSVTSTVTMTVTDAAGQPVTSDNGVVLSETAAEGCTFTAATAGTYRVSFTVSDGRNSDTYDYSVNVLDTEAPVIACDRTEWTVRAGDTVSLNIWSVTDNVTPADSLRTHALIEDASGRIVWADDAFGQYRFSAGYYKLTFVAYDEAGNMRTHTIALTAGV